MTNITKTLIASAAIAGILSGSTLRAEQKENGKTGAAAGVEKMGCSGKDGCKSTNDCKGKNSCKGKGGCKSGDQGCKGKNTCKGKGGCKSSHEPEDAK